jgi:cellulose biosynthesis protein BcsQ
MKVIANINFKGGVGKTTVTWLVAKYAAQQGKKVLVVDADAQMSLTIALSIDENSGSFLPGFGAWYETHKQKNKTILYALDSYDQYANGKTAIPAVYERDRPSAARARVETAQANTGFATRRRCCSGWLFGYPQDVLQAHSSTAVD